MRYAVIDDYGDEWETARIAYIAPNLQEAIEWAEDENFHSASIVELYDDGTRVPVR